MDTLKAEKRSMDIKAKKLRREGFVTGNVFGRDMEGSIPVKMEKPAVERLLKTSGKGSQILLDIEGQTMNVLIKEVDFNSLKGRVDEMDFQALVSDEKVHSTAEIILTNHEKVNTGMVEQHLHEVAYKAYPSALVDKIRVDVGDMKLGDVIKVGDLEIASNPEIDLATDPETAVASVIEIHSGAADTAEEEETAE